ncbi:MAG: non-canonical purine NTP pyrophosphatase [Clostridiales bacterium]|jgi:XTP/dITP diphosphohydrolase|nr:non-canonical purine NTP pyrophosphatase [Clostridiales bacterium]
MKIVIATRNKGKLKHFEKIFKGTYVTFCTLDDIGYTKDIVEDSGTFEGNSCIKASQIAHDTGMIALGEDSGLIVDALNGRPGVDTAYYAGGEAAPRVDRLKTLLRELQGMSDRSAKFVSYITCVLQDGRILRVNAEMRGRISDKIVDVDSGMTFEPIFVPEGFDKCLNQLDIETKLQISHRGKATRLFLQELELEVDKS